MEKLYTSKTFLKMAGGRIHTPHSTPGSAPGHKLWKQSKESSQWRSVTCQMRYAITMTSLVLQINSTSKIYSSEFVQAY